MEIRTITRQLTIAHSKHKFQITRDFDEWKSGEAYDAKNVSAVKTERNQKSETTVTVLLVIAVGVLTGAVLLKRKKKIK